MPSFGSGFSGAKPPTLTSQTFNSSGTFTVPAGVTTIWADVVGGGGNGFSGLTSSSYNGSGGNGGGGGMGTTFKISTTPGSTFSVVVGAGGGNQSSFGSYISLGGTSALGRRGGYSYNSGITASSLISGLVLRSYNGGSANLPIAPELGAARGGSGGSGGGLGGYSGFAGSNGGAAGNDGTFAVYTEYGLPGSGNRSIISGGGGGGGAAQGTGISASRGLGGSPGGGNGGNPGIAGSNGTANTGGGGGGGGGSTSSAGAGGTGGSGYVKVWWIV